MNHIKFDFEKFNENLIDIEIKFDDSDINVNFALLHVMMIILDKFQRDALNCGCSNCQANLPYFAKLQQEFSSMAAMLLSKKKLEKL